MAQNLARKCRSIVAQSPHDGQILLAPLSCRLLCAQQIKTAIAGVSIALDCTPQQDAAEENQYFCSGACNVLVLSFWQAKDSRTPHDLSTLQLGAMGYRQQSLQPPSWAWHHHMHGQTVA